MAPTERDVYAYVQFLDQTQGAATSAESFVKSVGFMHGVFTFATLDTSSLITSRVKGACRKMLQRKRPLKQARVFSTDLVWSLEELLINGLSGFLGLFLWLHFDGDLFLTVQRFGPGHRY